jgi:hypothetical protein
VEKLDLDLQHWLTQKKNVTQKETARCFIETHVVPFIPVLLDQESCPRRRVTNFTLNHKLNFKQRYSKWNL